MKLSHMLEDKPGVDKLRHRALEIQAELIDLLPDNYDVTLTDIFHTVELYHSGKFAVVVKHHSYTSPFGLSGGAVYIFPTYTANMNVKFFPKGEYMRHIVYDDMQELATDLEKNIKIRRPLLPESSALPG